MIEPTNGAEMLMKSVRYSADTQNRIAYDYDNNEFIVFEQTNSGGYSGHLRSWNGEKDMPALEPEMKEVLIAMEIVDEEGNRL